jgi:hypothetical protein
VSLHDLLAESRRSHARITRTMLPIITIWSNRIDLPSGRVLKAYAVPCGHGLGFALVLDAQAVLKWGCSIAAQISVLTTSAIRTLANLAVRTAAI